MFDTSYLLISLVFSSIGLGYFIYGKKQKHTVAYYSGICLIVYPYIVSDLVVMKAGWTEAEDLGDVANLISRLEGAGIACEGFEQEIQLVETKNMLISETGNAIARGVFGVPTMIIEEQLFWGNDQYDHMQLLLEGNDPVSPEELDSFTDKPRMIDRKAITNKN